MKLIMFSNLDLDFDDGTDEFVLRGSPPSQNIALKSDFRFPFSSTPPPAGIDTCTAP